MTPQQIEALKLAIQLRDTASGYWAENEIPIIEKLIELLADPMREVQRLGQEIEQEPVSKYCCRLCFNKSGSLLLDRMILCSECGNKRCPKATNHELQCTDSNAPNQAGSVFTTPLQRTEPAQQKKVWTFWDLSGGDIVDAIKAKIAEKNT